MEAAALREQELRARELEWREGECFLDLADPVRIMIPKNTLNVGEDAVSYDTFSNSPPPLFFFTQLASIVENSESRLHIII